MTSPVTQAQMAVGSDYKLSGPLAGFIGAQQEQDWRDSQARDFRNNDLDYASSKNKYEQELLDNPVLEAKRKLDQSKMGLEQEQYDSGNMKEQVQAEQKAKLAEAGARMTTGQLTDVTNRGKAVQSSYPNFDMDETSPASFAKNKEYYENQFLPLMKQMGGGGKYPPVWGPEAKAAVEKANQSAIDTIPHLQEMQKTKQAQDAALKLHREDNASKEVRAGLAVKAATEAKYDALPEDKKVEMDIRRQGYATPADVERLKGIYISGLSKADDDKFTNYRNSKETQAVANGGGSGKGTEDFQKWIKEQGYPAGTTASDYAKAEDRKYRKEEMDNWLSKRLAGVKIVTPGSAPAAAQPSAAPQGNIDMKRQPKTPKPSETAKWGVVNGTYGWMDNGKFTPEGAGATGSFE